MAENPVPHNCCQECADKYVCHCLCVTEDMVIDAILNGADTFNELRRFTDAGNGCTACHPKLRELFDHFATEATKRDAQRHSLVTV